MTSMAALTAGMDRPGATADLGPGGPPAARTTGPAGGDRSAAVSSGTRTVRSWPLLVLAAPAAAEVWSGWVGIAQKTGFGLVSPLPGILPSLHLDTSITLPVGVEAYAAYALRAWLAGEHSISGRTRRFAKWSAICSFALGMAGQVAYHLLAQAGAARAPWPVTTIVSCLPVLVLAMGTTLAHMLRADAGTAADAPDHGTGGPAVSRSPAWSAEDQAGAAQDQAAPQAPSGRVRSFRRDQDGPAAGPRRQGGNSNPVRHRPGTRGRQQACSSGKAGIQTCPAQRGNQGLQPGPERPGAHDQRRAGGHSSCPGQTRQRHGANLIPRRRASLFSSQPGRWHRPARCHRPDTTGCRETPSRVWSLTSATEGLDAASAVAGGLSDTGLKADSPGTVSRRSAQLRAAAQLPGGIPRTLAHRRKSPVTRRS